MFSPRAIEELRNQGPLGAILDGRVDKLKVLQVSPFAAIDLRRKVIEPLLSAFIRSPEELLL